MKRSLVVLSFLLLAACTLTKPPQVIAKNDPFSREIEVDGMWSKYHPLITGKNAMMGVQWHLRSFINKDTRAVHHQLYAIFRHYSDLKYFVYASDENAMALPLKEIYHAGGHCGKATCERAEVIVVLLDDGQLRRHAKTGYRIKMGARSGYKCIIPLTPEMVQKQLEMVGRYAPNMHPSAIKEQAI